MTVASPTASFGLPETINGEEIKSPASLPGFLQIVSPGLELDTGANETGMGIVFRFVFVVVFSFDIDVIW